ncbi:glutamyl-tRNA reductase [Ammonifex degensii KC4]|uniref:Glutamyl-tRNA reductase n=1 Tax=Ammonifex degensii (strain DSM 10501 / KC4) TaxID=429009 RepID=C9R7U1_AMMDK|nr:glutamyl-tRNA reductase [Ammonifex degensii]ACX52370.1 glutamyl-tRNA reductase [Ammonifex degensii KC4]
MFLIVVGLNHRTAPVQVRERFSFTPAQARELLVELKRKPGVEAAVLLSTCNRTEFYLLLSKEVARTAVIEVISRRTGVEFETGLKPYLYAHTERNCVKHLFRVASGLDSMVLGETQILGQVRDAYHLALEVGATESYFNALFQQALAVGKRVRTETGIDRNAVSVSSAAVELARQALGSLAGRTVLIVGAGKMGELTAKHLVANGVAGVIVSNRSFDHAQELAARFGGRAVRFDELYEQMLDADIVISCTAATHYVIHAEAMLEVMRRRGGRKLFLIDIAVPRDVDPEVGKLPGVMLYDIDALGKVVDENYAARRQAAVQAEAIIEEEVDKFLRRQAERAVVPLIAALKERGEEIKQRELKRALNRLGPLTPQQQKAVLSLANSLVNQLLHDPIVRLKELALTTRGHVYAEALQELFNLEIEKAEARSECSSGGKS